MSERPADHRLLGSRLLHSPVAWAAIALFVYLAFQIVQALAVDIPDYDEAIHLNVARSIRQTGLPYRPMWGGELFADHTPLYLYVLALASLVLGEQLVLLRLLSSLFGLGCVLLIYLIASRALNRPTGVAAAFMLAIQPFFLTYAYFLREEILLCFFTLLATWLLLRYELNPSRRALIGAAFAIAAAVLSKEMALVFLAAALLYLMLTVPGPWSIRVNSAARLTLPTFLGLFAWMAGIFLLEPARLAETYGRWLDSLIGRGFAAIDHRVGIEVSSWLATIARDLLGWEMVVLLLLGVAATIWRRNVPPRISLLPALYIGLAVTVSLLSGLKETRHLIGIVPAAVLLTNLLIDWGAVSRRIRYSRRPRLYGALTIVGLLTAAWSLSPLQRPVGDPLTWSGWWQPSYQQRLFAHNHHFAVLREAADFVAANTPPEQEIVVVQHATITSFYAHRPYRFLYTFPYERVMTILADTEILVYDEPAFFHLSTEEIAAVNSYIADEFDVMYEAVGPGRTVTVFRRRSEP